MSSTAIGFDRNANSLNRSRRNWQRLAIGAATGTINTSTPIINVGGTISLLIDPNGALQATSPGLGVKVDGTSIQIIGDKLVATGISSTGGLTHLQVMQRVSLGI